MDEQAGESSFLIAYRRWLISTFPSSVFLTNKMTLSMAYSPSNCFHDQDALPRRFAHSVQLPPHDLDTFGTFSSQRHNLFL